MLEMDPRTPQGTRHPASSLTTIASELAPTEGRFLSEPCPRQIVIYSELARDYLKRHGEPHYEH